MFIYVQLLHNSERLVDVYANQVQKGQQNENKIPVLAMLAQQSSHHQRHRKGTDASNRVPSPHKLTLVTGRQVHVIGLVPTGVAAKR